MLSSTAEWPSAATERFTTRLRPVLDAEYLGIAPWQVPPGDGRVAAYVMVEDYQVEAYRIDLLRTCDHEVPWKLLIFWRDRLVVGFQSYVHVLDLERREAASVRVEDNVESLFCTEERLLVGDRTGVWCLDVTGRVLWHRGGLGLAWVLVQDVVDGVVHVFGCTEVGAEPIGDDWWLSLETGDVLEFTPP